MTDAAEKLLPMIADLSVGDRVELMEYLDSISESGTDSAFDPEEWDPEFVAELDRRIADMESGRSKGIPAEEVFRKLREKYG